MSETISTVCDNCGTTKGTLNHWFRVVTNGSGFLVSAWTANPRDTEQHACGDRCVEIFLQKWLDEQQQKQP